MVVVALLGACGAPGTVLTQTSLRERLQEFLDQRAERLEARDIEGYLSTATSEAHEVEQALALGATMAPVTGFEFRLEQSALRGREATLTGIEVALIYRYQGLPSDNIFRVLLVYNFDEQDGRWVVSRSAVRTGSGLPVWASGPIHTSVSDHFLVLHHPDLGDVDRLLQEAEEARAQLDGKITFPLEDRYVILAAQDDTEYREMSGAALGPVSAIAQVETSYEVTPETVRVLGRQMVVNTQRLHQDGEALETLRHELGHLAVAQYTRPFTPAWVSESAAMFLAGTRPVSIWRNGLNRNRFDGITIEQLNRAANLGVHNPTREGASLEYAYSAAAAWYLVDTYGADLYWDFYRSYADVPARELYDRLPEGSSPLTGRDSLEALGVETTLAGLQELFALDPVTLDRAIREWMAAQVG